MDNNFNFDAEYLARLRLRRPVEWDHFCRYFRPAIRNKLRHRCQRDDVEDLVQDVLVAALRGIDAGNPQEPNKLPGYVTQICHHLWIRHWLGGRRIPIDGEVDTAISVDPTENIEQMLIRKSDDPRVRQTLEALPPKYGEVIYRVYFLEQDRDTIAREMGVKQSNVRVLLCRALQRFAVEWDKNSMRAGNQK